MTCCATGSCSALATNGYRTVFFVRRVLHSPTPKPETWPWQQKRLTRIVSSCRTREITAVRHHQPQVVVTCREDKLPTQAGIHNEYALKEEHRTSRHHLASRARVRETLPVTAAEVETTHPFVGSASTSADIVTRKDIWPKFVERRPKTKRPKESIESTHPSRTRESTRCITLAIKVTPE